MKNQKYSCKIYQKINTV